VPAASEGKRRRFDDVDLARDRELVERCQAGDRRAFEDLYLRYRERLYRFCLRRLDDPGEAEDATQEAFVRAWRALPGLAGERRFYPWLSVIAANLCTDALRRRGRAAPVDAGDLEALSPATAGADDALAVAAEVDLLRVALGRLSPRHREVLELRETRHWTYQRIAEHQGVEVSTVETLLFRARRSLRREFLALAQASGGLAAALGVSLRRLLRPRHGHRRAARLLRGRPGTALRPAALRAAPFLLATTVLVAAAAPGSPRVAPRPVRSPAMAPVRARRGTTPEGRALPDPPGMARATTVAWMGAAATNQASKPTVAERPSVPPASQPWGTPPLAVLADARQAATGLVSVLPAPLPPSGAALAATAKSSLGALLLPSSLAATGTAAASDAPDAGDDVASDVAGNAAASTAIPDTAAAPR
jgi:RNA polymerase sigma-70 factor (ECF subfamily)